MSSAQFAGITFGTDTRETGAPTSFSATVPVPSNAQAGDLMIITCDVYDAGGTTAPLPNVISVSGFTQVAKVTSPGSNSTSFRNLYVFWKRLTTADSGNYTITATRGDSQVNDLQNDEIVSPTCLHYKNVKDTGSPFDGTNSGTGTGSTTPSVSLVTTGPERVLLHIANSRVDPYVPPSGFTGRRTDTLPSESAMGGLGISDRLQAAAGSTGSVTTGTGSSSNGNRAWLGAILSRDKILTAGTSIATGAAFGTATVLRGAVNLIPTPISGPAASTGPTVRGRNTVTAGSTASAAAVPAPAVQPGAVTLGVSSIAAPAAPPAPSVRLQIVAPSIPTSEQVGEPAALAGDLVVPSIPSGEAFGAATLQPGAAALSVVSVGSAEALGAASVRLSVAPLSIGSAEAFGAASTLGGVAVVGVAAIASTEAVPSPWLQTQVLRPDGIPSLEHVNAAQVLLRVVVDDGVPGDLFIQSQPELLLGSAILLPTSIGSRESVPTTVQLSLSIDPSARGVRGISTVAGVRYEAVVMARLPQQTGPPTLLVVDAIDWLSIKWSNILNRPQELELTCLLGGLTDPVLQRLRAPAQLATELHVLRDGATVFAGPLMGGQKKDEKLALTARGLLSYLRFMVITDEDLWWPTSSDQHLIARGMVDHHQTKSYGHFGIDTSDALASGVLREGFWKADELHNVADVVETLSQGGDGFDVDIDPATRRMQMWTPKKGVDRSVGDDAIVFDARNITSDDVAFSIAPGDIASYAVGTGTTSDENETLYATATNNELMATFGRAAITDSWGRDAPDQATLQKYVNKLLDSRDQALWLPGPGVRVDPDSDPSRYDVGDYVWFDGGGRIGVSGKFRVLERAIEVDDASRETATLQFA